MHFINRESDLPNQSGHIVPKTKGVWVEWPGCAIRTTLDDVEDFLVRESRQTLVRY
jgi:hypothetical protein